MLGGQNCWEVKIVGSPKLFGVQKCWEAKTVRSTKVLGVQNCWEIGNEQTCSLQILFDGNGGGVPSLKN